MTDAHIAEMIAALKAVSASLTTKESATRFLIDAGIIEPLE